MATLAQARRRVCSVLLSTVALAASVCFGAATLAAQDAIVSGTVVADSTDHPLAGAEVSFPLLGRSARTDAAGNFRFLAIKPGRQRFRIRLVGYEPFESWLVVSANQKLDADFVLTPLTTKLETVHIKTDARSVTTVRAQEFEENQKDGTGHFIQADVFDKEQGRSMATIITGRIAGIQTIKKGGTEEYLAASRGGCYMQIYLNGLNIYRNGMMPFNINTINPQDVIGVETYSSAATPAKYLGLGAACGTLVIWTK